MSGIVDLGRDETRQTIGVPLVNDGLPEQDRYLQFRLFVSMETGGIQVLSELRVYIRDSDSGFAFGRYAATSDIVAECSEGAASVSVVVRRGGDGPGTVSVEYATEDGTTHAGADCTAVSGTLVFGPGEWLKTIAVPLVNDPFPEGDESFGIRLFNPSANAAIGTNAFGKIIVHDNDVGVLLEAATNRVREDAREFSVTVFKGVDPPQATVVSCQVDGLTAPPGKDIVAVSGTLEFGPGEVWRPITVPIRDDFLLEGPESSVVRLTASSDVVLGEPHVPAVRIVDV